MLAVSRLYFVSLALTLSSGQLLSLKDGDVGVNFGGYHASAGLGGLLTGDLAKGGLHASAGTPFGQQAAAGLAGGIEGDGASKGGLYAGATAGGGISGAAGLAGTAASSGSLGHSVASSSSLGVIKTVEHATPLKIVESAPVVPVTSFNFEKRIQIAPAQPLYVEKTVAPIVVHKVVERPVHPVYFQKTFVRRPHHWRKHAYYTAGFDAGVNQGPAEVLVQPQTVKVVERTYVKPAPVVVEKYVAAPPHGGGFITQLFAGIGTNAGATGGGEIRTSVPVQSTGYTATASVNKNGALFNDIFNIPISTLQAVGNLVNNIAGGTSVSVRKHYSTY